MLERSIRDFYLLAGGSVNIHTLTVDLGSV
jgi:hypothetical protein